MVLSFPFSVGFGILCVLGSLMSVSAGHWLGVWLGLELNMMGFIPLMIQGFGAQSVESSVKYFVVQALGSSFLLLGGFSFINLGFNWLIYFNDDFYFLLFCLLGLFLKLGVAPFHWWVPSVMGGLSWFTCGFLLTWQKLAPFMLVLSFCSFFMWIFLIFSGFSALVGGFMGIGQVQVRFLMAYSSISHWGWILGLSSFSFLGGFSYYSFYFFISVFIFYILSCVGLWRFSQISGYLLFYMLIGFMSLAGLPPFTGFVMKWIGLEIVSYSGSIFLFLFLILGALLSLYYYLSFLFVFVLTYDFFYDFSYKKYFLFMVPLSVCFFIGGLPFYEVLYYMLYAVDLFY